MGAVGIQLFEDLWHGTLHEIGHVDRVDIAIDNMEQIAELICSRYLMKLMRLPEKCVA